MNTSHRQTKASTAHSTIERRCRRPGSRHRRRQSGRGCGGGTRRTMRRSARRAAAERRCAEARPTGRACPRPIVRRSWGSSAALARSPGPLVVGEQAADAAAQPGIDGHGAASIGRRIARRKTVASAAALPMCPRWTIPRSADRPAARRADPLAQAQGRGGDHHRRRERAVARRTPSARAGVALGGLGHPGRQRSARRDDRGADRSAR